MTTSGEESRGPGYGPGGDGSPKREPALYRRVMGEAFDTLPPVLRRFHEVPGGGRGSGRFRVTRGPGRLHKLAADLGGLPPAGDDIRLELRVTVEGARERWLRHFDARALSTLQWCEDGCLVEASGPMRLAFRLIAEPDGMRFELAGCRWLGIPVPRALSPRVSSTVRAAGEEAWEVFVQIELPVLGFLCRYEGRLEAAGQQEARLPPMGREPQAPGT